MHSTEGSIFARDVMTQAPVDDVTRAIAHGREAVTYAPHSLYETAVLAFAAAVAGKASPKRPGGRHRQTVLYQGAT